MTQTLCQEPGIITNSNGVGMTKYNLAALYANIFSQRDESDGRPWGEKAYIRTPEGNIPLPAFWTDQLSSAKLIEGLTERRSLKEPDQHGYQLVDMSRGLNAVLEHINSILLRDSCTDEERERYLKLKAFIDNGAKFEGPIGFSYPISEVVEAYTPNQDAYLYYRLKGGEDFFRLVGNSPKNCGQEIDALGRAQLYTSFNSLWKEFQYYATDQVGIRLFVQGVLRTFGNRVLHIGEVARLQDSPGGLMRRLMPVFAKDCLSENGGEAPKVFSYLTIRGSKTSNPHKVSRLLEINFGSRYTPLEYRFRDSERNSEYLVMMMIKRSELVKWPTVRNFVALFKDELIKAYWDLLFRFSNLRKG